MDEQLSSDASRSHLSRQKLVDVIAGCQQERSAYRRQGVDASPCCVEMFRRAFAGNQEAWTAVQTTFERQVRAWIGRQQAVDPDDVVQETFFAFSRYAPAHESLLASDTLAPVVDYLRHCTRTAVLQLLRKERRHALNVSINETLNSLRESAIDSDADLRLDLVERSQQLLESEVERIVFQCRFVCNMKPQEIVKRYPHIFAEAKEVYPIVQRITNRLSRDVVVQELNNLPATLYQKDKQTASLAMSTLNDAENSDVIDRPCLLDEVLLLDYITGLASPELRSAIERSPACLAAARRIARTVLPLMQQLYRATCPDEATLVAYQEHRLAGTEQLVVRGHIAICPLCQEECGLLETIGAAPLDPPSLTRRMVEALLVSPLKLPQALRGEKRLLHYQSPNVLINVSVRKTDGKPRTWALRGEIRTPDGLRIADRLEAATLRSLNQANEAEREGKIAPSGSFVFQGLPAGEYSLSLLTPEEEILIRQLSVGEE